MTPSLKHIWEIIAFLEANPDDIRNGLTNGNIARILRDIRAEYTPNELLGNDDQQNER
jgi:hypothetical protein